MWAGWRLGDVPLRNEFGVTVLAVSRSGRSVFNPGPTFQLFPGDHLILTGEAEQLGSAVEYMARVDFPEEAEEEQDFLVEEVPLQSVAAWHGQTLAALDLRKQFDITVIAVRQGERLSASDPRRPLAADDHLVVAGRRRAIEALRSAAAAAT
jgi:K+/H+ antiporter YhaU regulatory subunit KhtT